MTPPSSPYEPDSDAMERLLRETLSAEAADVRPDPDALLSIQQRTAPPSRPLQSSDRAGTSRGGASRTSLAGRRPSWALAALGAAAATAAVITAVVVIGDQGTGTGGTPAADSGQTTGQASNQATTEPADASTATTSAPPPTDEEVRAWVSITSPVEGQTIENPVTVTGSANVYEANVNWELLDDNRDVIDSGYAMAGSMEWKPFTINLGRLDRGTYTVRAFESSAEDGRPTFIVEKTFTVR